MIRLTIVSYFWFILVLAAEEFIFAQDQTQPIQVSSSGSQPKVAIGPGGNIGVVYGLGNSIFYSGSTDSGKSYSSPVKVAEVSQLYLGMRRGPQIAITKDSIIVSAIVSDTHDLEGGNLKSWTSLDGGATWKGPVIVNDQAKSAREGLHGICAANNNDAMLVWLDLRSGTTKLYGSVSKDGGKSWSKNLLIYSSPQGNICECCHPSVVSDQKGNFHVMWRNWLKGSRDMYIASSKDHGVTFGNPQKLGTGAWPLDGCPMDGGALAVDKQEKVLTVWRRERTVYSAIPGGIEEPLGEGSQPVVTIGSDGAYRVWQSGDSITLSSPSQSKAAPIGNGAYPALASSPTGQGLVIGAWEAQGGIVSMVLSEGETSLSK